MSLITAHTHTLQRTSTCTLHDTSPYHTVPKDGRLSLLKDCYGKTHYSAEGFNLNYMENI